ncbi:MAG TPA: ABC transporter permease [Dehalococcoidia bacterium]|nr:ABC transporter permease [Dehalococcoidia bacterium]
MSLVGLSAGPAPRLALQNLLQDKLRLVLSVAGIALAVMLILFLLGLRAGVFDRAKAYLGNTPGSVAVLPQGVKSSLAAGSGEYLAAGTTEKIARTPGVARTIPVLEARAMPEFHGKKESVLLIGYDPALGGGAWELAEGREPVADNEIVLDRVLADRHNFAVGDAFEISGLALKVVGLSNGTSSLSGSYVFARKSLVEKLVLSPGAVSAVLVTASPGTVPEDLATALRQSVPGANVLLKSQVMANDQEIMAGIIDQIIMLMVGAAFIVGALVVGMVLYTATIERRSEYGILKAIGARGGVLYRVTISQAFAAAGLGVLTGIGFAYLMGWLVETFKPQFLVSIEPSAIALTVGAGFLMAVFGALVPARSVVSLAPAEVFRR